MKAAINKNYLWAEVLVKQLVTAGLKYACISPGSRNTPLTYAFDANKNIKTFVLPDERSSSFFALGLAKKSGTPVAVVTTSGTAVAELYPAIIESFQQRVPLIVCTADRPKYLWNTGANQTINQDNIFRNHIRAFLDLGLPEVNLKSLKKLTSAINDAFEICRYSNRGPVHLNIPFEKPLEPKSKTHEIDKSIIKRIKSDKFYIDRIFKESSAKNVPSSIEKVLKKLVGVERGLIICGGGIENSRFPSLIVRIAQRLGFPILADGTSSLRFGVHSKSNVISNYNAFISSKEFLLNYDPQVIIQFGKAPTSKQLLSFFEQSRAKKFLVSEFAELHDPSRTTDKILEMKPEMFCELFAQRISSNKEIRTETWLAKFQQFDSLANNLKNETIKKADFPFEARIIKELLSRLRNDCNLMISNSMPIRDLDYFASAINRRIDLFTNRGASGIDGIISTALGIAAASEHPTVLVTGDLAFYHDMNGLLAAMKYSIPLTIVLINNNGGGIFESLPVADKSERFVNNFTTPHNLDFAHFVLGYNGHYINTRHWEHFAEQFPKTFKRQRFAVIEIRTDARESAKIRKAYFTKVRNSINKLIKDETHN